MATVYEEREPAFTKGQRVAIINQTLGGRFLVEDDSATLIKQIAPDRWRVRFSDGTRSERFIDPAAQADPVGFVAALNERSGQ